MDDATIAAAVALRFDPTTMTAPTGYTAVANSTHLLDVGITGLPCVRIFEGDEHIEYDPGLSRSVELDFIARFYYSLATPLPTVMAALYAWRPILRNRLPTSSADTMTLGLSYVEWARITDIRMGWQMPYGSEFYIGFELPIRVSVAEAVT